MIAWAGLILAAVAFVLAALGTWMTRGLAQRYRIMDVPAGHKGHARPVPLLGGSAIFGAIALPLMMAVALAAYWTATGPPRWLPGAMDRYLSEAAVKAPMAIVILIGAAVLHVMGLMDDRRQMGAWKKLIIQAAVAAGVILLGGVRVLSLLGEPWSFLITLAWVTTITNAFNFLDNMDGLSAGVACLCAGALLGTAIGTDQFLLAGWLCLIIGALSGFLLHNFPPAKTFMGDGGSLVVGYLLAILSCVATYVDEKGPALHSVFVPLVLMAIPLYDMSSVVLLRIKERRNPMIGDNRHFSHRLVKRGMSVRRALLTIYLCTTGTAIAASLLPHVRGTTGAILVFAQTLAILMIVALLENSGKNR